MRGQNRPVSCPVQPKLRHRGDMQVWRRFITGNGLARPRGKFTKISSTIITVLGLNMTKRKTFLEI